MSGHYIESTPPNKEFRSWFRELLDTQKTDPKKETDLHELQKKYRTLKQEVEDTKMENEIKLITQEMVTEGESYFVMRNILERGRKETHFLDDIIGTDIYSAPFDAQIDAPKIDGKKVKWGKNEDQKGSGSYHKIFGVYAGGNAPTFDMIIQDLALTGSFPDTVKTLHHELIHGQQEISLKDAFNQTFDDTNTNSVSFSEHLQTGVKILKRNALLFKERNFTQIQKDIKSELHDIVETVSQGSPQIELLEAQAYRVADFQTDQHHAETIVNHVEGAEENGKKVYKVNREKMLYAVEAIDTLDALGFSNDEVSKLIVEPGKWSREKKQYENLAKIIHETMAKLGYDEAQLNGEKYKKKIKRGIDRCKIILIAREEIKIWKAKKTAESLANAR